MPTINDLRQQAATIKNATQVGENTATRVGTTFETIADLLEGMGGVTNLSTIDIGSIDTLNTTGDMLVGTPNIYTLTKTIGANTFKVGTLFQFANNGRYDVAQVIVSQFIVDTDGRIDTTSADQEVHIFYRLCKTMNGGSLPTPIGTWTTWTELGGSGGSGVTIDPYPTQNSGNAVSSGGVFERLQDVAPKVDISAIDDIDEYSDMLATKSPFYVVTKTLSGNVFRIGTLMEFANQGRYILYQILATDYVLNDDGTLDTTLSENGGLKLIWRMKQFSGNPPEGMTIGVWTTWAKFGDSGYQPNNEDIDLNASDQLQLANKLHDASAFSGLGRVYLRKNIVSNKNVLTQAMVNTANTIYHIQYDYDLNGQTITLPTGCVLNFDGGSIKNGTLSGDFNIVAGLEKIFDNVTFTGACINNTYELDWFVKNKNTSVDLTSAKKDSTTEVQAAFNSGVMNFHVSNKYYYYLSAKVTIKSWVALVGEKVAFTHQRNADNSEPCFYTDQAITMMEVVGDSDNNTKIQKEIILDEIHFRHFGTIANGDYHESTPILSVTNGQGVNPQVWGVRLNVHILFSDRNIAELGKYMYGYTGIEINASNGFLTYLDVSGNVRGVRRAIYVHKTSTAWITDTRLSFDTNAVRGGEVLATPVRLTGSHQPVIQLTAQELAENPCYFKVGNGTSTAMVWDLGATGVAEGVTYYNVTKAFETTTDAFHDFISNTSPVIPQTAMLPAGNNDFRWREEELWKFLSLYPNLLELVFHNIKGWQLLDNTVTGIAGGQSNKMRGVLESVRAYKTANDYIELTPNDVRNWARIPCLGGVSTRAAQMDFVESNKPCINSSIIAAGYKNFEVCYTFSKKSVLDFAKKNAYLAVNADWTSGEANTIYLSIEFCDDTDTILETKTIYFNATSNIYYTDTYLQYFKFADSATAYTYIRLRFRDFRTLTASTPVARFGIIGLSFTNNIITTAGGEVAGPMVLRSLKLDENNNNAGCRILHNDYLSRSIALTTNYKPILNICSYFQSQVIVTLVKSTGGVAIVTLNKSYLYCSDGDISCKLEVHTDNYTGRYFLSVKAKENINVYIADVYSPNSIKFYDLAEVHQEGYFDTTFTTDIILTSGTSGQRPVLQASDKGFTYFDTTLDRLLFWNGIGWMGIVEESILLDYLVMEAEGTGTISFTIPASVGTSELTRVSYSLNGFNWIDTDNVDAEQVVITTPELTEGQKVYWKGIGRKTATSENDCSIFSSTTDFSVSGNLLSLIEGDDFEGKELTNRSYAFTKLFMGAPVTDASELKLTASSLGIHVYSHMFHDCTKLVAAPSLSACTSLATYTYQYAYMFKGCTSLLAAPDLPATIIGVASYYEMFNGCTNLESAPAELPATTLASNCYRLMFGSCVKLTTAPVLPAVTLEQYCYYNMFYGCTLLNYVKAMFTTTPANAYTYNWLYNVAANGTFVKNAAAEWTLSGATGIPSGWTIETATTEE